jgi:MscS family membrane protein
MYHKTHRRDLYRRALAVLLLLAGSSFGWATAIDPLDTSSPRATFDSFLEWTRTLEAPYADYLSTPNRETQRALIQAVDQGLYLLDLSEVAPTARREIGVEALASIWEVVARAELPRPEDIPDASAFAQGGPLAGQRAKLGLPLGRICV